MNHDLQIICNNKKMYGCAKVSPDFFPIILHISSTILAVNLGLDFITDNIV